MSIASKKVPIAFVTGLIGLGLGIGGGIVLANFIEKEQKARIAGRRGLVRAAPKWVRSRNDGKNTDGMGQCADELMGEEARTAARTL